MYAEFARRVGSGGHNTPRVAATAHHYRLTYQRRIVELFHRHEERVHVDMEYRLHSGFLALMTRGSPARSRCMTISDQRGRSMAVSGSSALYAVSISR